jgi:hypothetical protein
MIERATSSLMPGICASRVTAFSTGACGLVPAPGPVVPSVSTPRAAGIAAARPAARAASWAIRASRKAMWSSRTWASSPWWASNMPSRAATRPSCLARIRARASPASTRGSRSPAIIALIMPCAEMVVSLLATEETLTSAPSSSFSSRCQHQVRSRTSRARARV